MAKPALTIKAKDTWAWLYDVTGDDQHRRSFLLSRETGNRPGELRWLLEVEFHSDVPKLRAKLDAIAIALTGKVAPIKDVHAP